MKNIHKFIDLWAPPILWAILIFKFSSGTVPVASNIYWQDFAVKKTGHVLLFGIFAILLYRSFLGEGMEKKKAALLAFLITFFYGATDEYHQFFTQGREARVRDIFIDGAGAFVSLFAVYKLISKFPKKVRYFLLKFGIE